MLTMPLLQVHSLTAFDMPKESCCRLSRQGQQFIIKLVVLAVLLVAAIWVTVLFVQRHYPFATSASQFNCFKVAIMLAATAVGLLMAMLALRHGHYGRVEIDKMKKDATNPTRDEAKTKLEARIGVYASTVDAMITIISVAIFAIPTE